MNNSVAIGQTLAERGTTYGKFIEQAEICRGLKNEMHATKGWGKLSADQAEALDMIQHKIARILNGNPNFYDSWHDIAGYATLVATRLFEDQNATE